MIFLELLLLLALVLIVFYTWKLGISPMPTSPKVKEELFKLLPNEVNGDIYELGSGWGTLARSLAAHYTDHEILAYELSPVPYLFSRLVNTRKNLHLKREDFFTVSLKEAGLVVCYLYPGAMLKLKAKFESELKPGALVLSHTFAIPGWKPVKIVEVNDLYRTKIYLYII